MRNELGTRFCRRCGYCQPCPQGVQIVTLMTMETLVKCFPVERLSEKWIAGAAESVAECIECGECEEKCPYKLSIMEEIRRGADAFRRALRTAVCQLDIRTIEPSFLMIRPAVWLNRGV